MRRMPGLLRDARVRGGGGGGGGGGGAPDTQLVSTLTLLQAHHAAAAAAPYRIERHRGEADSGEHLMCSSVSALRLPHAGGNEPTRPTLPKRSADTRPPVHSTPIHVVELVPLHTLPVQVENSVELKLEAPVT